VYGPFCLTISKAVRIKKKYIGYEMRVTCVSIKFLLPLIIMRIAFEVEPKRM
jgi:hypothetical protein